MKRELPRTEEQSKSRKERSENRERPAEALRDDLRTLAALEKKTEALLAEELRAEPDAALEKNARSLIGRSRGARYRMGAMTRSFLLGLALAGGSLGAGELAGGAVENALQKAGDTEVTSEDSGTISALRGPIVEIAREQRWTPGSANEDDPFAGHVETVAEEDARVERELAQQRQVLELADRAKWEGKRQQSRMAANELIDMATTATSAESLVAARGSLLGPDDYDPKTFQSEMEKGIAELEKTNPDAALKLAKVLGSDATVDFALRHHDAATAYEETVARLSQSAEWGKTGVVAMDQIFTAQDSADSTQYSTDRETLATLLSEMPKDGQAAVASLLQENIGVLEAQIKEASKDEPSNEDSSLARDKATLANLKQLDARLWHPPAKGKV